MHTSADRLLPSRTAAVTSSPPARGSFAFNDARSETTAQRKIAGMAETFSAQQPSVQRKANDTGLPDNLKSGIENLSGHSMDDVKVHYNSDKPQQLNAHAYAQGTDIHLASGQEKHLPHEAWHVVQQKQGRVKATAQLKGVGLNDDQSLEKEADNMGAKAAGGAHGITQLRSAAASSPVVQRRKDDAEKYISDNGLGIDSTRSAVMGYVNNPVNSKVHRQGLLDAYNLNNRRWEIPEPADLSGMDLDGLEEWDSEDEDAIDLDDEIEEESQSKHNILRSDGKIESDIPKLPFYVAIRIGRQIVKRKKYKKLLPLIMGIGDHLFELNSPYSNDIYVTPLEKVEKYKLKGKEITPDNTYRRMGQSKKFNYTNLSNRLSKRFTDKGATKIAPEMMHHLLKSNPKLDMKHETAETLGAMGADFMKGSFGARYFIRRGIRRIAEREKAKKEATFRDIYLGQKPIYTPAMKGGRGQVVIATLYAREVRHLLLINNCLINAVSRAALGRNATIDELIQIRFTLGSLGEMLLANQHTIDVIREALGIDNAVRVHYPLADGGLNEDFDDTGAMVRIYHTNGNHFQHNCPDATKYDMT